MKKLLTWDKSLHFVYMFAIQIVLLILIGKWSLLASVIIPLAKEMYDLKVKKSVFDITDLFVGVIGGTAAYFAYMLF